MLKMWTSSSELQEGREGGGKKGGRREEGREEEKEGDEAKD